MSNINFLTLNISNDVLYLNGLKLRGVEAYELKKSSSHLRGTAELKVTLIVKYSDNTPMQNHLRIPKEKERKVRI